MPTLVCNYTKRHALRAYYMPDTAGGTLPCILFHSHSADKWALSSFYRWGPKLWDINMSKGQNWDGNAFTQPGADGSLSQLKCNFLKDTSPESPDSWILPMTHSYSILNLLELTTFVSIVLFHVGLTSWIINSVKAEMGFVLSRSSQHRAWHLVGIQSILSKQMTPKPLDFSA